MDHPTDSEGDSAGLASDGLPLISPDRVEEQQPDEIDNVVPTRGYDMLPVVALGGSAGSIPALRVFLEKTQPGTGLAYVVILHLAPEHESMLPELLQRHSSLPVCSAADGQKIEADHVYVIPPGKYLTATDGHLRLTNLKLETGKRVAVDLFFRSLADTHGPHATAIVLSGADGDGAIGLKRIKERGGLTVAQDPAEAEHPSMPSSAIATGMVDWVLPVKEMPDRIAAYLSSEERLELPLEDVPQLAKVEPQSQGEREHLLRDILTFLRTRTGRDFSPYKRATIVRRISRRMQVAGVDTLRNYLSHLRTHPGEAGALLQDLLISVTNFFRDRETFAEVQRLIPELFHGKRAGDTVRIWCAACATGEEAYSMAMLLLEHARQLELPPTLQVFGCDLNEEAIQQARAGFYPSTISADVNEERLRRFFLKEPHGYRVRREVREMVLFATHDLLKDAPFSRMDMVSCRNLLIYLNTDAQRRALNLFHFALRPGGLLFLGGSETVEEGNKLFEVVDKKHRLYRHQPGGRTGLPVPIGNGEDAISRVLREHDRLKSDQVMMPGRDFLLHRYPNALARQEGDASAYDLHFKMLGHFGPPSVVVDAQYEVIHVSENANRFLQVPAGEPTRNLLRIILPILRVDLRAALLRAAEIGGPVIGSRCVVNLPGGPSVVSLRVSSGGDLAPGFLLVLFSEIEESAAPDVTAEPSISATMDPTAVVQQLEREITRANSALRDTVEQYEANTEELKASNEELQAMNEELRSSGEELETGREELQSVNEELTTVNVEYKGRAEELARLNSDLHNLMNATQIATIFLDRELNIMRYTPSAITLFNLIPGDIGRPITNLKMELEYPELATDAAQVLQNLATVERELRSKDSWFLCRILPYRTVEDQIIGLVLTFVDITDRIKAEDAVHASEAWLAGQKEAFQLAIDGAPLEVSLGVLVRIALARAGPGTQGAFYIADPTGSTLHHVVGMPKANADCIDSLRIGRDSLACGLAVFFGRPVITPDVTLDPRWKDWREVAAQHGYRGVHSFPIETEAGKVIGAFAMYFEKPREATASDLQSASVLTQAGAIIISQKQEVEERARAEAAVREGEERLRLIVENAREYAIFSLDLDRTILSWNSGAERILGYSKQEAVGQKGDIIFTAEDRAAGAVENETGTAFAKGRASDERWHVRKDGSVFWGSGVMTAMHSQEGAVVGYVKIFRDETQVRAAREALEQSRRELTAALKDNEVARAEAEKARAQAETAGEAKDNFLAVLSHELRTPLTPVAMSAQSLSRRQDLPAPVRESLEMIRRNVQLEARLVDDLLDVTKIERGKMELSRLPLDVHEVILRAVEITKPEIEVKEQQFKVQLQALRHSLEGDAGRLQQVVWNLLKNASKFTPEGGKIDISTWNETDNICIEVRDTGIGIESGVLPRIFDAFSQADASITRRFGGLGLGLAIAHAIVAAHEGEVRASSEGLGHGATFSVCLPLNPSKEKQDS